MKKSDFQRKIEILEMFEIRVKRSCSRTLASNTLWKDIYSPITSAQTQFYQPERVEIDSPHTRHHIFENEKKNRISTIFRNFEYFWNFLNKSVEISSPNDSINTIQTRDLFPEYLIIFINQRVKIFSPNTRAHFYDKTALVSELRCVREKSPLPGAVIDDQCK